MASIDNSEEDLILHRQVGCLKDGQIERFKIRYTVGSSVDKPVMPHKSLWVKVKNIESIALRAAYLAGPYVLYVDCRTSDYDVNKKCFVTAEQPTFEPQLLPGQSFYAELSCHTYKDVYEWTVDVISQVIFNNTVTVGFEFLIGTSKKILHESSLPDKKVPNFDKEGTFISSAILDVIKHDTDDLWNLPIPDPDKPIHLVILTHGLHSNVSVDMLYLKEEIDKVKHENIVVKGFFGNVAKTERGIKYLGSRVAEYIIELVTKHPLYKNKVDKISFIGHSLGGLVQTFAIAYLKNNFSWFFETIQPINFIALASPMLGVVNENPLYVKLALSAGLVGRTGQDIGLKCSEDGSEPLLVLLPTGPTHQVLKGFVRRTVYSNAINDGIVPLRTSSLLYLDYRGLSQVVSSSENKMNVLNDSNHIDSQLPAEKIPKTKITGEESGFSPVQSFLSYFMPQKQSREETNQLSRFQTTNGFEDIDHKSEASKKIDLLSRSSILETASSLILPPLPPTKYITDPDSRDNVIIHDQIYEEKDLPPPKRTQEQSKRIQNEQPSRHSTSLVQESSSSGFRKRLLDSIDYNHDKDELEERIAREYHKNMNWRKVLVKLNPDAHNNIIVRRRFANAYGWPVIDHLVENHFRIESTEAHDVTNPGATDSMDHVIGLSQILSRELISRQNDDIDNESRSIQSYELQNEHHWINSKDNSNSIFAVGPAGLLADVSEMVGNFKESWTNYAVRDQSSPNASLDDDVNDDEQVNRMSNDSLERRAHVMGDFI